MDVCVEIESSIESYRIFRRETANGVVVVSGAVVVQSSFRIRLAGRVLEGIRQRTVERRVIPCAEKLDRLESFELLRLRARKGHLGLVANRLVRMLKECLYVVPVALCLL